MNDEEMVSSYEAEEIAEACDPLPTPIEENGSRGEEAELCQTDAEADAPISDADSTDPDPTSSGTDQASSEEQLERLRNELKQLRSQIAERDKLFARMGEECEEFHTLYPNTSLSSLPDRVWEDVRNGVPIAAAWALAERRQALMEQKAEEYNRLNNARSSGALSGTESDYFSPTEVRAMTPDEVRVNYQKIMRSMQKWH